MNYSFSLFLAYFLSTSLGSIAQTNKSKPAAMVDKNISAPIFLWPNGAPGEMGMKEEEKDMNKPSDDKVAGKSIIKLANVSKPSITIYRPKKEKDTGASMVVCPGGGYYILAMDLEGTEVCEWLNSIGVTAILLKYRVPVIEGTPKHLRPLQDAQRALGMLRYNAQKWGLDPHRIGIMGFSAGGHLSAALSTNYSKRIYEPIDGADQVSCRPDFTILIYPAYLTANDSTDLIASNLPVTSQTPPTFIIQTQDDFVKVESSVFYYMALKKANVPVEMHLYANGGHGYGLRKGKNIVSKWPLRAEEWFHTIGILKAK